MTELICTEKIEKNEAEESLTLHVWRFYLMRVFERLIEDIKYKLVQNKLDIVKFYAK